MVSINAMKTRLKAEPRVIEIGKLLGETEPEGEVDWEKRCFQFGFLSTISISAPRVNGKFTVIPLMKKTFLTFS